MEKCNLYVDVNNNGKKYDEYFDFGFHINKNNDNFQIKNKRIKSATKLRVKDRKGLLTNNKYFPPKNKKILLNFTDNKKNNDKK